MNEELMKQYQEALEAYYKVALPEFYQAYIEYYKHKEGEVGIESAHSTNPPKPPPPPPPPGGGQ